MGIARIAITSLINSHNPYTSDEMMEMNIYAGNPDFKNGPTIKLAK
jgi:hypothetical protein